MRANRRKQFVVCVANEDYPASLELRKIYEQLPDRRAESHGLIRVIDEDGGEGYLYPADFFIPLDLPKAVETAVEAAAQLEAEQAVQ